MTLTVFRVNGAVALKHPTPFSIAAVVRPLDIIEGNVVNALIARELGTI